MDEAVDVQVGSAVTKPARLGDTSKCPVCGTRIHTEAFCCPKCRNYFCYQCRSRVSSHDIVLQCVNRACDYFGKFVCSDCDAAHDEPQKPMEYMVPIDGYWPLWLVVSVVAGVVTWYYATAMAAWILFFGVYLGIGYLLQVAGCNIFGKQQRVELKRVTKQYDCNHCKQPSKIVPLSDRR